MDKPTLLEQTLAMLKLAWEHPDWFIFGLTVLSGAGLAAWRWLVPRLRRSNPPATVDPSFPFEVVKPKGEHVLKTLMGSEQAENDPLADFNIAYQERRPEVVVQQQLEGRLEVHRWLLILGRTGLGKTREAAELAQRFNGEGWTVLKLKNAEQLTVPTRFPAAVVGEQPRLLFFLDNLNQAMNLGNSLPKDDSSLSILKQPLQERLKDTLAFFESCCGTDRIRVIATARNETEPDQPGQPSEWAKLAIEQYPSFWQRFDYYELPVPAEGAIVNVLAETTEAAQMPAQSEDFAAIAQRNDGTFRNVVENLERAKNRGQEVSKATYKDTLKGTWESRYQTAVARDKTARPIYDAIDLLRQCNVELREITVLPTAALLAQRTKPWHLGYRHRLRQSLGYLSRTERILQPRDGQIEAKGYPVEVGEYIDKLGKLLINLAQRQPSQLENSLAGFVVTASGLRRYRAAFFVNQRLTQLQIKNHVYWYNQGVLNQALSKVEEAITCYDTALIIKPDYHQALNNKGNALSDLGRLEEAIDCYDAASAIKPDLYQALNNKGIVLSDLGRLEEAIDCYDAASAIKPDFHEALNNKGTVLSDLGRLEDAIACYDAALALKPDLHEALNNKGNALSALGSLENAIDCYDAALYQVRLMNHT